MKPDLTDTHKPRVLVVDDVPQNLAVIVQLLEDECQMLVANGGERALKLALTHPQPDLILLDIVMPDLDGMEVLQRLKSHAATAHIPVIFLTSRTSTRDESEGLEQGAADYITKPVVPAVLRARVHTQLTLKAGGDFLRDKAAWLEAEVARRTRQLNAIQDVTVFAMSSMAETRDNETGNHILRTQRYVKLLAERMRGLPHHRDRFTPAYIEELYKSAPLHDIGKVGIPDAILLKPDRLTPEEFEVMKTHTTIGYQAIVKAEAALGTEVAFLHTAKEIALSHQEKWDGSGYPQGLKGEGIPISARLMALADVYDALITRRVYKPAFPHAQALEIMAKGRGSHFDPEILDQFMAVNEQFRQIARQFADNDTPEPQ